MNMIIATFNAWYRIHEATEEPDMTSDKKQRWVILSVRTRKRRQNMYYRWLLFHSCPYWRRALIWLKLISYCICILFAVNYSNELFEIQVKLPRNWVFITHLFLNQACAGLWPVHAWFLKIDPVWIVCMHVCVCPPSRLLITIGVI